MSHAIEFLKMYVKGQLLLCLVLALLYSLGFGLVGLPWGYAVGAFTGFFAWIPFVGSLLGFFMAMIIVAVNFSWPLLLKVAAVYLVCQLLESLVLAPQILGRTLGLGFWPALGAVLVGALLFGPVGAMLAVPFAAFAKYLLEKKAQEKAAEQNPPMPPPL